MDTVLESNQMGTHALRYLYLHGFLAMMKLLH